MMAAVAMLLVAACASAAPAPAPAPAAPAAAPMEQAESWGQPGSGGSTFNQTNAAPANIPAPVSGQADAVAIPSDEAEFMTNLSQDIVSFDRMIIRTSDIDVETADFPQAVSRAETIATLYGGFVESSRQFTVTRPTRENYLRAFWQADYVLRVPVHNFDVVNRELIRLGQVAQFATSSEDVTMQFQDLENRLSIREEEERRLMIMINNATNLDERIRLESQLTNLRLLMETYRRRMTEIDQLASFSTIRLSLHEVEEEGTGALLYAGIGDDSFGERMSFGFVSSFNFSLTMLEGIVTLVAVLIIPLLALCLPALGGFSLYKKLRHNKS